MRVCALGLARWRVGGHRQRDRAQAYSVAVSDNTIVAGALFADVEGKENRGAAYAFVQPTGGWASGTETAKLTASDGAAGSQLARSVAVSGDAVVAGALGTSGFQGAAYVFVNAPTMTTTPAASKCVVPRVVGKTLGVAKTLLTKAHCKVGRITKVRSAKVAKGHVVSAKPTPGRSVRAGTAVALTVSRGK